ncbi:MULTISPECIES: YycH family regulatory protein [Listeria]|uniref:YycH family regulatory protein n=1 Tax=Listeria TaxID=1637 RepID=UPI000B587D7B|nr:MULTISPECIES: two-component system activity regulator YycH [Listeria]
MKTNAYLRGAILTVLVIFSIVLSYFIWKGQPDYETIDVKEVEKTTIDKQKTAAQVFKPMMIQVNKNDTHFQTNNGTYVNELAADGRNFSFSEVVLSGKKRSEEYDRIIHQNGAIELIYPNNIPFSIFAQVFQVEGKKLDNASFNRIIFDTNKTDTGLYTVYFTNDYEDTIYQSSLQEKDIESVRNIVEEANKEDVFNEVPEVRPSKHSIFLSNERIKMSSEKYIIDSMDINLFTKALFQDVGSVKNEDNSYTNGSSKIVLDTTNKVLEYINPAQEVTTNTETISKRDSRIQDSFNFINEHAGWTDNYYYTGYYAQSGTVNFGLFVNNLQVLNSAGMSQIYVTEGQEAVYKYSRPFFKLDYPIPRESEEVTLPSSLSVYKNLESNPNIDIRSLQMITLGYEMSWVEDKGLNRIVELRPTWIFKYNGQWFVSDMKESE